MVVSSLNCGEDPIEFIRRCRPDRVKLIQFSLVPGVNDNAADLVCPDGEFRGYADRLVTLGEDGIDVVFETSEDVEGSYAMIDALGRFYQRPFSALDGAASGYVMSPPILEVGVREAFRSVGGYSRRRFLRRGGNYDAGRPADGNRPYWIAIEGLDGSGKSTVARGLADALEAALVTNPPRSISLQREAHDRLPEADKRAWYRKGNYQAVRESLKCLHAGRPVVMDRSYASTAAFAAAWQGRKARPEDWPDDMERPDLILFLNVRETERCRRILGRGLQQTPEEARLRLDAAFRELVIDGYRALGAVLIDADSPRELVLESILALIRDGAK